MHRRHCLVTLVSLVVLLAAVPAFAGHAWGNYHWGRTANPFVLKTHDNLDAAWETYLSDAQKEWNTSSVLDINVIWQKPLSSQRRCASASGVIEVCNEHYGQNGWLGVAGISVSGSHITKGYTKVNDTYFDMAQYNTPAWRDFVMCQEIGHDFGLDHQDETFDNANLGSCMDYTNDPDGGAGGASSNDPSNRAPNSHDYAQLETIYQHTDSVNTYSLTSGVRAITDSLMTPIVVPGDEMNEPWQWGTPVAFDSMGRGRVYVLHVDHDEKWITHVTWAPEVEGDPTRVQQRPRGN